MYDQPTVPGAKPRKKEKPSVSFCFYDNSTIHPDMAGLKLKQEVTITLKGQIKSMSMRDGSEDFSVDIDTIKVSKGLSDMNMDEYRKARREEG